MITADETKKKIRAIIQADKARLETEAEHYRDKAYDTSSVYGFGGPYERQMKAAEKREAELERLKDLERQVSRAAKHLDVSMYVYGCRSCGTVIMTSQKPTDDWHECPACRGMIHCPGVQRTEFQIVDNGKTWMELIGQEGIKYETDEAD